MHIRPAVPSDMTAIAIIQSRSWQNTYRNMLPDAYLDNDVEPEMIDHWTSIELRPEDVVLVAEESKVVGFIAVWCRPDPFIDNLHVLPRSQSKGTGRKLMRAAATQLCALGHSTAYLWVMADNARAIDFYEKLGGQCTELCEKEFSGHYVPNWKIEWSNIAALTQGD